MKTTKLFQFFSVALLVGMFGLPLVGCGGVESEPIGVEETDEELEEMETEEYIEGERGT